MKRYMPWHEALHHGQQEGEALALITVLSTAGSTPRDANAKMVVSAAEQWDTIGGGHLEYQAIQYGRELLAEGQPQTRIRQFELGASLGQCCGGAVQLLFEVLVPNHQTLAIFGAGHVARNLLPMLQPLALRLRWIDSRKDWLPESQIPGIHADLREHPVDAIADLPENAWVLVLTHNHQLDFELTQAALKRPDIGFLGVIGSDTKARRFRQRLTHRGWSQEAVDRMICPVGLKGVPGKQPAEVAIAIAAQIVQKIHSRKNPGTPPSKKATGLDWRSGRQLALTDQSNKDGSSDETD